MYFEGTQTFILQRGKMMVERVQGRAWKTYHSIQERNKGLRSPDFFFKGEVCLCNFIKQILFIHILNNY